MRPATPDLLPLDGIELQSLIPVLGPIHRALSAFDNLVSVLPEPGILLAPMTTQEAVLSSRIEGTQATLGDVLSLEAGADPEETGRREDIFEILNYRRALGRAEEELKHRPFNLNLLLEVHAILLDSVRGMNKGRGRFRTVQNWSGAAGSPIEHAQFVPPEPSSLPVYLDNWEKHYHADFPDPIVQLAVLHAQFEIIHPFVDGNGRLGRMLIPLFLYERGVLSRPVFYASAYLESRKDEYIARLRDLQSGPAGWNRWVEFFLRAVLHEAVDNAMIARGILTLYNTMKVEIPKLTRSHYALPILDVFFEKPIFSTLDVEKKPDMPTRQGLLKILNQLRSAGIIDVFKEGSGRRPSIFVFRELLDLCEGRVTAKPAVG